MLSIVSSILLKRHALFPSFKSLKLLIIVTSYRISMACHISCIAFLNIRNTVI